MSNFTTEDIQQVAYVSGESKESHLLSTESEAVPASHQLAAQELGFRDLTEMLPQLIWTCRADGACDYLSPQWVAYTGIPEAAQLGSGWAEQIHPDDQAHTLKAWNASVLTGTTLDTEFRIRRHDGVYRWFKTRAVPFRNSEGQIVKWFGSNTDVNDQKQTEEALRQEKERFSKLALASPGVILSYRLRPDGTGHFPYASPGVTAIYGFTPEELREDASPLFRKFHHDDLAPLMASIKNSAETMTPWYAQWRVPHAQKGEIWVEGYSMPVLEPDGSKIWHGVVTDITERKRAELAAAHLAAIVESSEDAIIGKDLQGIVTSWNRGAEKVFGYTAAEMIGQPITCLIPPDRLEEEGGILSLIRHGASVGHFDTVRRHKNGHLLDVSIGVSAIKDAHGKVIGASKVARNITERKRAENALRLSEEHLRLATEAALMGTWERDLKTDKLYWSASMERLMGYEPGTFPGTFEAFYALVHPDSRTQFLDARNNTTKNAGTYRAELRFKLRDGRERWGLVSGQMVYDVNGKPDRIVGVDWDITERKRVEEALNKSQAQLEAVFQSIQDGLVVTDMAGNFLMVNDAEVRICGFASAEEIKQNLDYFTRFFELRHADGRLVPVEQWPLSKILHGESVNNAEFRVRRLDTGKEWFSSYSGEPVFDAQRKQTLAVVVTRDISERKESEEKIYRLNEELEQRVLDRTAQLAAVNKELEAFSYSVSHDLRAPLRHINGFSQALLEDYADKLDEVGKSYLNEVRNASTEMARLIDDVLQLARVTRLEMCRDTVDLSELVSDILETLQKRDPERTVKTNIAKCLKVNGDKRLLSIMVNNLLENAWKFTSKKAAANITFGQEQRDGNTVFFIRDDGAGFDMAYVGKLFGAFQRLHTSTEFEGTGIGLATVQRVISRHGGSIWCQGAVNKGATFFFMLPQTERS